MNFLVTGSSSYVGKYIIKYLLNEEHDVIGTSRSKPNIINKKFFFIKNNLTKNQIKIKKK
jgi:nucleoside-diphosphate-sugar epimerase